MKHHFIATLALSGIVSAAAHAATVVQNYDEAKAKAGDDGFVLVVYPDGWNKKAGALGQAVINSPAVGKAAGNAAIMGVAIPNVSTKEVQEARKKQLGPIALDMGRAQSYPAIYLYETGGQCGAAARCYAVIPAHGYRVPNNEESSVAAAASAIGKRLAAIKEQRALMKQAESATGDAKFELIGKAINLEGISRPDKVAELVKKEDPQDESGLQAAIAFDWANLVWTCVKQDWKAGLQRCEDAINNPALTPHQKQLAYICAMGALRRNAGKEGMEKMVEYGKEMRLLDSESVWGQSYAAAMRLWNVSFSLECGWTPIVLPTTDEPTECGGPWPIHDPGTYKITFNYTGGSHALKLSKVELYNGITKVGEDAHTCSAGRKQEGNVYTFRVTSRVSVPRIIVTTDMGSNRDSYGTISVTKE